jgi:hypothetical protein
MAAPTMTVCEEDVTLAVIFREAPTGRIDAHVKGNMDPRELVYQLREIANHIELNGPVDG